MKTTKYFWISEDLIDYGYEDGFAEVSKRMALHVLENNLGTIISYVFKNGINTLSGEGDMTRNKRLANV